MRADKSSLLLARNEKVPRFCKQFVKDKNDDAVSILNCLVRAARIASVARRGGAKRLIHISGIGADAASPSPYIRSRGEGEAAVQAAFPGAVIIRPAVMFAQDDSFSRQFSGFFGYCPLIRYSATAGHGFSLCTRMTLLRRLRNS